LASFPESFQRITLTHHLFGKSSAISISCIHFLNFVEHCSQSVFQLPELSLRKRDRRATVALARHVAMYLLHTLYGFSFTLIGAHFSRSRKTVAHACAVIENLRDDPAMDRVLSTLESALGRLQSRTP
jgi:chromosomal replication initiation ATPase DnaA